MKKLFIFALAFVACVLAFTACEKNGNNSNEPGNGQTAQLASGTWVCQVNANGYMYFEFSGNSVKFHEVGQALGSTIDAWIGGTYTLKGNTLTFSFTDSNVEEMKANLDKYEKTATLDGDKLLYSGHTFTLQK